MDTAFWAKIHGGSTHFPIALIIASMLFDIIGYFIRRDPLTRDLHAASFYALLLGALGSFLAVFSGLMVSGWEIGGGENLAKHHNFVWPAFALIVALAVWRLMIRDKATRNAYGAYLLVSAITAVLMATAGYWGGELLLGASS